MGTTLQRFTIHEGLPSQLVAIPTGQIQGSTTITLTPISGDDSDLFTIDSATGEITFASITPANVFNFENPQDDGGDNIFNITLSITDGVNTTTQGHVFQIEDLAKLNASQFENNLNSVSGVFQSFGSQEAFVNALTDGTLTWNPSFAGGGITFSNGSANPVAVLNTAKFVYTTLGHTFDIDMTGTFSGVAAGDSAFRSGTFKVDINERAASQFISTPGSFIFSTVATPDTLTIVSGEELSLTATATSASRDMAESSNISATLITNNVQQFAAGVRIGVGSGADFAAQAGVRIIDSGGATIDQAVGLGVPTVGNQQSQIDN